MRAIASWRRALLGPEPLGLAALGSGPVSPRFGAGSVIGRTFSVWRENVLAFSGIALLLQAPVLIGKALLDTPATARAQSARAALAVAGTLLGFVLSGVLTSGVLRSLRGEPIRFGELLEVGARRFWPILLASFGAGLRVMLGLLMLVVPGVVTACSLALAAPAAAVEPERLSVARSRELTEGHRLGIFAVLVVVWLAVFVATAVSWFAEDLFGESSIPAVVIESAVTVVGNGLWATWPAIAYHDLRIEKEGVDPADVARVFE